MTTQEIKDKVFEKAVFGGYSMPEVDDYLDEICTTIEALEKENATLNAKMQVLVKTVNQYRAGEETMRQSIISAQEFSEKIKNDAKAYAEKVMADADAAANERLGSIKGEVAAEEARLAEIKASCTKLIAEARGLCLRQLDYLGGRASSPAKTAPAGKTPESSIDETVRSIEASVEKLADEAEPGLDLSHAIESEAPGESVKLDDMTRLFNMN